MRTGGEGFHPDRSIIIYLLKRPGNASPVHLPGAGLHSTWYIRRLDLTTHGRHFRQSSIRLASANLLVTHSLQK